MSREESDKHEFEGAHIENNDIKNVFEDAQDLVEDVLRLMDPSSPENQYSARLDMELFHSKPITELLKMVLKDFGITDKKSAFEAAREVMEAAEDAYENCPYIPRARKAAERVVRYYAHAVKISDLPKGDRMSWVNNLTKRLYDALKSDDPIPTIYRELHRFERVVGGMGKRFARTAMKMDVSKAPRPWAEMSKGPRPHLLI